MPNPALKPSAAVTRGGQHFGDAEWEETAGNAHHAGGNQNGARTDARRLWLPEAFCFVHFSALGASKPILVGLVGALHPLNRKARLAMRAVGMHS